MSNIRRYRYYFVVLFIMLFTGIGLISIIFIDKNVEETIKRSSLIKKNKLSSQTMAGQVEEENSSKFAKKDLSINKNNVNVAAFSPIPTTTLQNIQSNSDLLNISVLDYLGDPIKNGTIQIDHEKVNQFRNGILEGIAIKSGNHVVNVTADGYKPYSNAFIWPNKNPLCIILEYHQSHTIQVFSNYKLGEFRNPVSDAQVNLYKERFVIRPPQKILRIPLLSTSDIVYVNLQHESGSVYVTDFERNTHRSNIRLPHKSDTIYGFCKLGYPSGFLKKEPIYFHDMFHESSQRLKVWDAISLFASSSDLQRRSSSHSLFYQQDNQIETICVAIPTLSSKPADDFGKTNSQGICKFENLKPGLYSVQGEKGKSKTQKVLLHPAIDGHKVYLFDGSNEVSVRVIKSSAKSGLERYVPNVTIQIVPQRKSDSLPLYASKTNQLGIAGFENVPFGDYIVKAIGENDGVEFRQEKQVAVDDIKHNVTFTVSNGLTVAGYILDQETNSPIPDYTVYLLRRWGDAEQPISENYGVVRSNKSGYFTFTNVRPGKYALISTNYYEDFNGYLPPDSGIIDDNHSRGAGLEFEIKDKPLLDLKFFVLQAVKTSFSGIVINNQNKSVSNAKVSINNNKYRVFGDSETNNSGEFSLWIYTAKNVNLQNVVFSASTLKEVPEVYSPYANATIGPPTWNKITTGKQTLAWGRIQTGCTTGSSCEGLRIVIQDKENTHTLQGILQSESRVGSPSVMIYGKQNGEIIYGEVFPDWTYSISWLDPGMMEVHVIPEAIVIQEGIYKKKQYHRFCHEVIPIEIPESSRRVDYTIQLRKSGILAGRIFDNSRQPVSGLTVHAFNKSQENSSSKENIKGQDITDDQGLFYISAIPQNLLYSVSIVESHQNKLLMENTYPDQQNIMLELNR